jgi:hypothetical protein
VAIQAYQAGTAHAGNLKKEMEAWYRRAVRRAKQAVDRHDPDNRDRWLKRLGL